MRTEWPPAWQRRCSPLPAGSGVIRLAVEEAPAEPGPGRRHSPVRLRCDLRRPSRLGCPATTFLLIGQMPITVTAIGVLAANCILDCPGVEAWGRSKHFERRCVRSSVAQARGAESLPRHRAGRLTSLPAKESEGRQQPRLLDSRREYSLLANATTHERTRVGRQCSNGVQPANGDARHFWRSLEATVELQTRHRRNRVRAKDSLRFASDAIFAVPPDLAGVPRRSSLLDKCQ